MTYPIPNYERVWVRGRFVDLAKAAREEPSYGMTGPVQFIPSPQVTLNDASKQIIDMAPFVAHPDPVTGYVAVQLPTTDDPDINPVGWTYEVIEPTGRRYNIIVPSNTPVLWSPDDPLHNQPVIELVDVVPNPEGNPGTVQTIVGQPGRSIESVDIDEAGHLIGVYDDGMPWDAGVLPVASVNGRLGHIVLTASDVGLENADNTSDVDKPVSTAQQTAIDAAVDAHEALPDPHPQYLTPAEGTAAYAASSHNHNASGINAGQLATDRMPQVASTVRPTTGATGAISIDPALVGNIRDLTATGNLTVSALTTGAGNRQVIRIAVLASGADRTVTFDAAIRVSTGLSRGPYTIVSGQVLLAAIEFSTLLNAWVLTAATISVT